jgi:hypothetical protein
VHDLLETADPGLVSLDHPHQRIKLFVLHERAYTGAHIPSGLIASRSQRPMNL